MGTNSLLDQTVFEYVDFNLPSRGVLYPNGINTIKIRPTKTKEEKIIRTLIRGSADNTEKLCKYISAVTNLEEKGLNPEELTGGDQLAILTYSRIISMDQTIYPTEVICPDCGRQSRLNINLLELEMAFLPEDYTEPREVLIPRHNLKFDVRLIRVKDSIELLEYHRIMLSANKNIGDSRDDIEGLYAKSIVKIYKDNAEVNLSFSEKRELLIDMDSKSLQRLIRFQDEYFHGYKTVAKFECPTCLSSNEIGYELGQDFFFMTTTVTA